MVHGVTEEVSREHCLPDYDRIDPGFQCTGKPEISYPYPQWLEFSRK